MKIYRKTNAKLIAGLLLVLLLLLLVLRKPRLPRPPFAANDHAAWGQTEGFMSLSNGFSGQGACLDSGPQDATMAPCGKFSGQQWSQKPQKQPFNIPQKLVNQNPAASNKCLDLNNGDPVMADCTNTPNQLWWVQGNKTIQNLTAGLNACLDIVKDGEKQRLKMQPCSPNAKGQQWSTSQN
jgi:hypothetical protein